MLTLHIHAKKKKHKDDASTLLLKHLSQLHTLELNPFNDVGAPCHS
jgi:hypothetical protein